MTFSALTFPPGIAAKAIVVLVFLFACLWLKGVRKTAARQRTEEPRDGEIPQHTIEARMRMAELTQAELTEAEIARAARRQRWGTRKARP